MASDERLAGQARPGICRTCGTEQPADGDRCVNCGAFIEIGPRSVQIRVSGSNAAEVEAVARQLAEDAAVRREKARLRSPWFSGLFYLTLLAVVISLLLVVGRVLALWALPIVIVGAVLLVAVVGAFQMRQDDRLSERGFLRLMADVLRRLPALISRRGVESNDKST